MFVAKCRDQFTTKLPWTSIGVVESRAINFALTTIMTSPLYTVARVTSQSTINHL